MDQKSFKFACPHCGQHLEAEYDMIGISLECPICGQELAVPAINEVSCEDEEVEEPVAEGEFLEVADDAVGNYQEENAGMKVIEGFLDKKWLVGGVAAVVLLATVFGVTIGVIAFQRHTVAEKGDSESSEELWLKKAARERAEGNVYAAEISEHMAKRERDKKRAAAEKGTGKSLEKEVGKMVIGQKVYNGNSRAEYIVGLCFTNGVSRNYAAAVKLYKAAQRGNVPAQFALAEMFMKNTDNYKDPLPYSLPRKSVEEKFKIKAFEEYRKVFESQYKYVPAACDTSDHPCVDDGGDVAKIEAAYWYRKAAEQGYAPAQFRYGECLKYEKSVKKQSEAGSWFKKAAEQGFAPAVFELSRYTGGLWESEYLMFLRAEGKEDPRPEWLERAAYQGYAPAQYELGRKAEENMVLRVQGMAMSWYRKAADQGHADAMVMIGLSYYLGKNGVEVDKTEARRWLEAGARDSVAAMNSIESEIFSCNRLRCYARGQVVYDGCDIEEVIYWCRKAMVIEQGYAVAKFKLAKFLIAQGLLLNSPKGGAAPELLLVNLEYGMPDFEKLKPYLKRVNLSEPMRLIRKAAELNWSDAQIALGDCYALGVGVTTDANMAAKWYRKAVENGSDDAKERLKKL